MEGHHQDRPHAYAGCDAADARPGVLRLHAAGRERHRAHRADAADADAAGAGRHRRRHRPQRARSASPRRSPSASPRSPSLPFTSAPNKFEALAAHDAMVFSHGAINTVGGVAVQDRQRHPLPRLGPALGPRRAVAAGERAGLVDHAGQGQPDPVRGADAWSARRSSATTRRITFAGSQGHFELNVFNPVMAYNFLQSVRLLADAAVSLHRQLRRRHRAARGQHQGRRSTAR